ncbi:MAG: Hpt domain-containing protein [Ferruginibacter sp.]
MNKVQEKYTNLNFLRAHTQCSPDLMIEMIEIYQGQTPQMIKAMKSGLLNSDWQVIRAAAHKLKPSFRIMGINKDYHMLVNEIERLAVDKSPIVEINNLVDELENACNNIYDELNVIMKELQQCRREKR